MLKGIGSLLLAYFYDRIFLNINNWYGDTMNLLGKIELASGFVFDYTAMLGTETITAKDIEDLDWKVKMATEAVNTIRTDGIAKAHLSKDGTYEPVFFTRLPFVQDCNPNTPQSITELKNFGLYMQKEIDAIVFLGIGGSYLGNKVLFDVIADSGWNVGCDQRRQRYPRIYFSGNNLDVDQYNDILNELNYLAENGAAKNNQFKVLLVPISKSGTTLETVAAFHYFYEYCNRSEVLNMEVTVVTDFREDISPLFKLAKENNWRCFDIKEGIGGRFCVFSEPGLLTAVAVGMDIDAFLRGAQDMEMACKSSDLEKNPALLNASLKYIAAQKGVDIEIFMPYAASMKSVGEWYVQLLAESLGKRKDREGNIVYYGRTPVAAVGSTDMHAQTQQHQDGKRDKVVQFVEVVERKNDIVLQKVFEQITAFDKYDGLNIDEALKVALAANSEALSGDGRLNSKYILPRLDEYYLGQLLYFLMLSIAYEGELADVDAYDQPGVEIYKHIMKEKMKKD